MEIPSNQRQSLQSILGPNAGLEKLRTGQQLYAKVIKQLPNKNDVVIRLGNQLIQVKSEIQATVGQTLKVHIEKNAHEIILKVKPPTQPLDLINATLRHLLPKQSAVNAFQLPLTKLLSAINTLPIGQQSKEQQSLAQLKQLSIEIIQSLPNRKDITTTAGLKSALQNSGIFLEPRLLRAINESKAPANTNLNSGELNSKEGNGQQRSNIPITTRAEYSPNLRFQQPAKNTLVTSAVNHNALDTTRIDLKANLIKLIQILKSWPRQENTVSQQTKTAQNQPLLMPKPTTTQNTAQATTASNTAVLDSQLRDLTTKAEGSLSKITLNQLSSSHCENTQNRQAWQLEIPVFNHHTAESIFLRIEKDEPSTKNTTKKEPQWSVSLEMNPPKLGIIKNKLTLLHNQINSSFWAENADTRMLIQQHLNTLRDQFNRVNLKPDTLQVQSGPGPKLQKTNPASSILSEKA